MTQSNESNLEARVNDHERSINQLIDMHFEGQRKVDTLTGNIQTLTNNVQALVEIVQAEVAQRQLLELQSRVTFDRLGEAMIRLSETQESVLANVGQMQAEIRGLQTENRRILDILQNRESDED